MQSELKQQMLATLAQVPFGKVATYGQIAKQANAPGYARQVGQLLKQLPSDSQIP